MVISFSVISYCAILNSFRRTPLYASKTVLAISLPVWPSVHYPDIFNGTYPFTQIATVTLIINIKILIESREFGQHWLIKKVISFYFVSLLIRNHSYDICNLLFFFGKQMFLLFQRERTIWIQRALSSSLTSRFASTISHRITPDLEIEDYVHP